MCKKLLSTICHSTVILTSPCTSIAHTHVLITSSVHIHIHLRVLVVMPYWDTDDVMKESKKCRKVCLLCASVLLLNNQQEAWAVVVLDYCTWNSCGREVLYDATREISVDLLKNGFWDFLVLNGVFVHLIMFTNILHAWRFSVFETTSEVCWFNDLSHTKIKNVQQKNYQFLFFST